MFHDKTTYLKNTLNVDVKCYTIKKKCAWHIQLKITLNICEWPDCNYYTVRSCTPLLTFYLLYQRHNKQNYKQYSHCGNSPDILGVFLWLIHLGLVLTVHRQAAGGHNIRDLGPSNLGFSDNTAGSFLQHWDSWKLSSKTTCPVYNHSYLTGRQLVFQS